MGETSPNQTILIVDDMPANLRLLVNMLKKQGYKVQPTTNSEFALRFAWSALPDLILLDIIMPRLNGYQLCEQLKADERTCHIPVIFLSAMDQPLDKIKAFEVGGVDYITKPFQVEEVLARVQTHLTLARLQKELSGQNERLEQQVKERTAELVQANTALQGEIAKRQEAEALLRQERASLVRRVTGQTEDLSKANAELVKAARLKNEFLANVSHELRTPLNVILGMSEIMREGLQGPLNTQQLESLTYIEAGGRHLLAIINDILDLSKIGAGKVELELGPISIGNVARASLNFIKLMAQKKRIEIFSNFDYSVTMLQADEHRLRQILVNLLTNAVKFTPEGGQVGLEIKGEAGQGRVNFIVWDTGIGIAADQMGYLFKPFIQLDAKLSRRYEGTGLGLALVARLVEMHGGGISVESQVGQGSRFTVSLPWSGGGEAREELNPSSNAASESPPLILLAEDNEANIAIISSFLTNQYRLVIARNGLEAIEQAQEAKPDLVLMDIQMPVMDGLEAINHIRGDRQLKHVPIITFTALTLPGDRERYLAAGANDYLSKPVSQGRLLQAIREQL
jgi:signal transduction histidine kinase